MTLKLLVYSAIPGGIAGGLIAYGIHEWNLSYFQMILFSVCIGAFFTVIVGLRIMRSKKKN